jgi:hypothetical protein
MKKNLDFDCFVTYDLFSLKNDVNVHQKNKHKNLREPEPWIERIRKLLFLIKKCEIFQIKLCETNVQNAARRGKKTEDVIPSVLT